MFWTVLMPALLSKLFAPKSSFIKIVVCLGCTALLVQAGYAYADSYRYSFEYGVMRNVVMIVGCLIIALTIRLVWFLLKKIKAGLTHGAEKIATIPERLRNEPDSHYYAQAEQEINDGAIDKGLWAKALVNAKGNKEQRKAEYIKLRAKSFTAIEKEQARYQQKKPKNDGQHKFIILLVAAIFVGVVIGGAIGVMNFMGDSPPSVAEDDELYAPPVALPPVARQQPDNPPAEPAKTGRTSGEDAPAVLAMPVNVSFQPFLVNLSDVGDRHMMKLTMSVEADSQELADEINAKMAQIRDPILLLLSSIQSDDVSDLDGKQRLKNHMLNRINPNLTNGQVKNIFFTELVMSHPPKPPGDKVLIQPEYRTDTPPRYDKSW